MSPTERRQKGERYLFFETSKTRSVRLGNDAGMTVLRVDPTLPRDPGDNFAHAGALSEAGWLVDLVFGSDFVWC